MKSPNLGPRSPGLRGKRERLGIMTSPELLAKKGVKSHGKAMSDSSANGYAVSVSSTGLAANGLPRRADENDDLYLAGAGGALPGWGAGWSVQRNDGTGGRRRDGRVESIMLQDVGKLIT